MDKKVGKKIEVDSDEDAKEKSVSKKIKRKEESQLKWILFFIVGIFVIFFAVYFAVINSGKFDYAGVNFNKEKHGDLNFYHGRFPVVYNGKLHNNYNFWFRNDPRFNKIPVETNFSIKSEIVISLDSRANKCDMSSIASLELSKFLNNFPWVRNVTGALTNKTIAESLDIPYASCGDAFNDKTIIILQISDSPSIVQGYNKNCYILNVGQCENLKTVERFIVSVIGQINSKEI